MIFGWFLIIIGVFYFLSALGILTINAAIFWPIVLIFFGVAIVFRSERWRRGGWGRMWHHAARAHWEERRREDRERRPPSDKKERVDADKM